jgi:hypothetical protein
MNPTRFHLIDKLLLLAYNIKSLSVCLKINRCLLLMFLSTKPQLEDLPFQSLRFNTLFLMAI